MNTLAFLIIALLFIGVIVAFGWRAAAGERALRGQSDLQAESFYTCPICGRSGRPAMDCPWIHDDPSDFYYRQEEGE